jgi:hypothetical protein
MNDKGNNLPSVRHTDSAIEPIREAGRLVARVASEAAHKHLQAAEDRPSNSSHSLDFLMQAIPSLGVAANCLIQVGHRGLSAKDIAIVQLETFASLRSEEIGANLYSQILCGVADFLKSKGDIKLAISWIMGVRDSYLGFSLGLDQFSILQSLLRTTGSRGTPAEKLERLQVAVQTHLGLYQQEGDVEGAKIYGPLWQLVGQAKSLEAVERLCESNELLNRSLKMAADRLTREAF